MDLDRGPWRNSREYVQAMGRNEIAWIESHTPRMNFYRSSKEPELPDEAVSLLAITDNPCVVHPVLALKISLTETFHIVENTSCELFKCPLVNFITSGPLPALAMFVTSTSQSMNPPFSLNDTGTECTIYIMIKAGLPIVRMENVEKRNLAACDQCHRLKLKCVPLLHECGRCRRLGLQCKSERIKNKRGRKPSGKSASSDHVFSSSNYAEYPVLRELVALGICHASEPDYTNIEPFSPLCSIWAASRMLDHLYMSPNQELHCRIIRKSRLFENQNPRPTSPALLCSMLCLACYVPSNDDLVSVLNISHSELVTLRRGFISRTMRLLEPVMLGHRKQSFDDALTAFMLTTIGASEDSTNTHQSHWLSFLFLAIRKLGPSAEIETLDEEEKEEHRRLWWATYIVDRHVALSFNIRPQLTDQQCHNIKVPCADALWTSLASLDHHQHSNDTTTRGVGYTVQGLDIFGLLLPLLSILGDILEYHHLRQHPTFGSSPQFLSEIRQKIEHNLQLWNESLQSYLAAFSASDPIQPYLYTTYDSFLYQSNSHLSLIPKIVVYAKHLYHCMHILLYGRMDLVCMWDDLKWQASSDFLAAGEHANRCAELAETILVIDKSLFLIYRLFGTYLLQSSFFFLVLANKLGSDADELIIKNCSVNLHVLDAFVKVVNIAYQRTFVSVLRRTLERMLSGDVWEGSTEIDKSLLQYRWTEGYHGLWKKD